MDFWKAHNILYKYMPAVTGSKNPVVPEGWKVPFVFATCNNNWYFGNNCKQLFCFFINEAVYWKASLWF